MSTFVAQALRNRYASQQVTVAAVPWGNMKQCKLLLGGALVALASCNDGIPCPGPALLAITAPSDTIVVDSDASAPGMQTTVRLRSTLPEATPVQLTVVRDGMVAGAYAGEVDAAGALEIRGVELPLGEVALRASAESACGISNDEIRVIVQAQAACAIEPGHAPVPSPYFGGRAVLNGIADRNADAAGLQDNIIVRTPLGWRAELFVASDERELGAGSAFADRDGVAAFALTYPEGNVGLRATCYGPNGETLAGVYPRFWVDSLAPTCKLVAPGLDATLNAGNDASGTLTDGFAITAQGAVEGRDVLGAAAKFSVRVDGGAFVDVPAAALASSGWTQTVVPLAPAGAALPQSATLVFVGSDQAGNLCSDAAEVPVASAGCAIAVQGPVGAVRDDADGNRASGAQLDVDLAVSSACAGRTVTASCRNRPSQVVTAAGQARLRLDMCATLPCEASVDCTFEVSDTAGQKTRAATTLVYDDQGPALTLALGGGLRCGDGVTAAEDQNPNLNGVQIRATVLGAATAASLDVISNNGTASHSGATTEVTLFPGRNRLVASGQDEWGNRATLPACELTQTTLGIRFRADVADGSVGLLDGSRSGNNLNFALCGTLSQPGASVTVGLDGELAQPATVTGAMWCRAVALAQGSHRVVVQAVRSGELGQASLALDVDLTPPPPIATVTPTTSAQGVQLRFTAVSDNGARAVAYQVRAARTPLTPATFTTAGFAIPVAAPSLPGAAEVLVVPPLAAGNYWFGIATVDAAGNLSTPTIVGPVSAP